MGTTTNSNDPLYRATPILTMKHIICLAALAFVVASANPQYGYEKPCEPETITKTQYKTKTETVPEYRTVTETKYVPTTIHQNVYKTKTETEVVPEYRTKYLTQTQEVTKYK